MGDPVRFMPAANFDHTSGFSDELRREVTGRVDQVNEAHRWYRVRWEAGDGSIQHEVFKF